MNITQTFYDNLAPFYDKLFQNFDATTEEQAEVLHKLFEDNGIFVGSIRDYDALLKVKPPYSPPYIHKTEKGQRVCFQTWEWSDDHYKLTQYIVDDGETLKVSKFECEYRATKREELTTLFLSNGCSKVSWLFPEETGFYQPIVIAKK